MKTLIIIILILLVLGLYFIPDVTKSIMKTTGQVISDISKEGIEKIKETEKNESLSRVIKENLSITIGEE